MDRCRRWLWAMALPIALCPGASVAQQSATTASRLSSVEQRVELLLPERAIAQDASYTHGWTGLGLGVTVSALVLSLDDVLGSSCFGSGSYLRNCRVAYVASAAVVGGLGALIGRAIRTEEPRSRTTRLLLGTAAGALGAFVASTLACDQEEASNPTLVCGYDGMVATRAVVGGAVVGGTIGVLLTGQTLRFSWTP